MELDDDVCLCFHVTKRKLVKYVRLYQPSVPSLLSECGGAGTGCMWCVPILQKIWEQQSTDDIKPEDHAKKREAYLAAGKKRLNEE
jgi:bacterioferritin-associated ferredoxin